MQLVAFVKKHWTWLGGLVGVIWTYASPSIVTALASAAAKHPVLAASIAAMTTVTAAVSPSPIAKGN